MVSYVKGLVMKINWCKLGLHAWEYLDKEENNRKCKTCLKQQIAIPEDDNPNYSGRLIWTDVKDIKIVS